MFYMPRTFAQTQFPQAQQRQQQNPLMSRGSVATTNTPAQPSNPMSNISDVMTAYKEGKGGMQLLGDAGNLYSRLTMPSGVTPGSVMAGSGPLAENASFLAGAAPAAGLGGGTEAVGAAANTANTANFLAPGVVENPLTMSATASPLLEGAGATGAEALGTAGAADTALATGASTGAEMLGGAAATGAVGGEAAAAGGAALGAEAAGLGMLGPIGILAGAGLLGTKLAGLW